MYTRLSPLHSDCASPKQTKLFLLYELTDAHDLASLAVIDRGRRERLSHPQSIGSFALLAPLAWMAVALSGYKLAISKWYGEHVLLRHTGAPKVHPFKALYDTSILNNHFSFRVKLYFHSCSLMCLFLTHFYFCSSSHTLDLPDPFWYVFCTCDSPSNAVNNLTWILSRLGPPKSCHEHIPRLCVVNLNPSYAHLSFFFIIRRMNTKRPVIHSLLFAWLSTVL